MCSESVRNPGACSGKINDYISLEELRALSRGKLMARWEGAQFPFECASCSLCVTMHKYIHNMCDHEDFKREASHLSTGIRRPSPEQLRTNIAEIYALRMFHRDLYASTPEPPAEAPALETAEMGAKSR